MQDQESLEVFDNNKLIELFEEHKSVVLHGLYINRWYDMDDLWQDILVYMIETCLPKYDPTRGVLPQTYLLTCGRWYAYRQIRAVLKGRTMESLDDLLSYNREPSLEDLEILDKIIVMVSSRHRKVLGYMLQDYNYTEIASKLGVTKQRIAEMVNQVRRMVAKCFN